MCLYQVGLLTFPLLIPYMYTPSILTHPSTRHRTFVLTYSFHTLSNTPSHTPSHTPSPHTPSPLTRPPLTHLLLTHPLLSHALLSHTLSYHTPSPLTHPLLSPSPLNLFTVQT